MKYTDVVELGLASPRDNRVTLLILPTGKPPTMGMPEGMGKPAGYLVVMMKVVWLDVIVVTTVVSKYVPEGEPGGIEASMGD